VLFGALAFITTGFASINVYAQVVLVTLLLGLISKQGILIDRAVRQRTAGRHTRQASGGAGGGGRAVAWRS
jgi:multidrug efflux pump